MVCAHVRGARTNANTDAVAELGIKRSGLCGEACKSASVRRVATFGEFAARRRSEYRYDYEYECYTNMNKIRIQMLIGMRMKHEYEREHECECESEYVCE